VKKVAEEELSSTRKKLEKKVVDVEKLLTETRSKLANKDSALISLNADLESFKRLEQELKSQISNQKVEFKIKLEKVEEQLKKSTLEADMLKSKDECQEMKVENSFMEEKLEMTELVRKLQEERNQHFANLNRCRKELQETKSELENQSNRSHALEGQGMNIRHVITDMRLEMEKMRKKFKEELDKKVDEISRYKQKDIETKRKNESYRSENNQTFDSSDIHRELRETKQKLSELSSEREHLMDINNCLKADLNKVIHTAYTPIRDMEYTPRSNATYKNSPWGGGSKRHESSPPTLKRTRLKERLNEIKNELAGETRF